MEGLDLLNGEVPDNRVRVFETYGGAVPNLPGAKAIMGDQPPMRQAVIDGPWKLIIDGRRNELFNLEDDPLELEDLSEDRPDDVARLRKIIEEWDAALPRVAPEEAKLSEDDIEALENLGYIE